MGSRNAALFRFAPHRAPRSVPTAIGSRTDSAGRVLGLWPRSGVAVFFLLPTQPGVPRLVVGVVWPDGDKSVADYSVAFGAHGHGQGPVGVSCCLHVKYYLSEWAWLKTVLNVQEVIIERSTLNLLISA
jgi:hypothetical protein